MKLLCSLLLLGKLNAQQVETFTDLPDIQARLAEDPEQSEDTTEEPPLEDVDPELTVGECEDDGTCPIGAMCQEYASGKFCICVDGFEKDNETGLCEAVRGEWSVWTACSATCGGGFRTRTRQVGEETEEQKGGCATEVCPVDVDDLVNDFPCDCPNGLLTCSSSECGQGKNCQRTSLTGMDTACFVDTLGTCGAWGDPHVVTFDGQNIDVYGVGTYVFIRVQDVQINVPADYFDPGAASAGSDTISIEVLMSTFGCGSVSCAQGFETTVVGDNWSFRVKVEKTGQVSNRFYNNLHFAGSGASVASDADFDSWLNLWNFVGGYGAVRWSTPLGISLNMQGINGEITMPYVFNSQSVGLCGNYNQDKSDEFTEFDGTVHEYDGSGTYRDFQLGAMFDVAKSWLLPASSNSGRRRRSDTLAPMETGGNLPEQTITESDEGPEPADVEQQLADSNCDAAETCSALFENPQDHPGFWDACLAVIDTSAIIDGCIIDYCQIPTPETIADVYQQFINQCKQHLPKDNAVCTFKTVLGTDGCASTEEWNGCPDNGAAPLCEAIEDEDDEDDEDNEDSCDDVKMFQAQCLNNMVVQLTPHACFTQKYPDVDVTNLIIHPPNSADASEQCRALTGTPSAGQLYYYSDNELNTAVADSSSDIFYSVSVCGSEITKAVIDGKEVIRFTSTIQSDFEVSKQDGLFVTPAMLGVDVTCIYESTINAVLVPIDTIEVDSISDDKKVADSGEDTQVSADVVDYQIQLNNEIYNKAQDGPIPLGELVILDILGVGPVTDYHIFSCEANNKKEGDDFVKLDIITDGCPVDASDDPLASINPTLINDSKSLSFGQFAFSSGGPNTELSFSMVCAIKFGPAPDCTNIRRRVGDENQQVVQTTLDYDVAAADDMEVIDGLAIVRSDGDESGESAEPGSGSRINAIDVVALSVCALVAL